MGKYLSIIFVGIIVSAFFFPFSFTFAPSANTKMILAAVAIPIYVTRNIYGYGVSATRGIIGTILIASLFSLTCLFAAEVNNTTDYSYATYMVTAIVWIAGGYATCFFIRWRHDYASLRIVILYLAAVGTFQCVSAILIDQIPALASVVNSIVEQGNSFLSEIGRLYGIGASLDSGGVRFCIILILITSLLTTDKSVKENKKLVIILLAEFFIITILGSMISRTTSVGAGVCLLLFLMSSGIHRLVIVSGNKILYSSIITISVAAIAIATYLYKVDPYYEDLLRFAFEGFFNWIETGEWSSSSLDKLNAVMWIWPDTTRGWIIGNGLYGSFIYSTDIGYCRFVLYCGLIGLSIFSLYFVYNASVFIYRYPEYKRLFLALLALTFIVWYKVSTDIFQIYALLYCIDGLRSPEEEEDAEKEIEEEETELITA